jgi:hypothetical protein
LAESGSWWLLLCGFGVGVGSWVELGAEGVQSGLVAVGQGWVIGFGGGAFGMIVGEWVIVVVDGWLLMVWVWLVVVGGAAVARRGSRWVDGGSGRCGWVCWWFMGLDGGVPYFPMECLPFWLGYCVGECRVCVIWGCWENATSV